MLSIDEVLGCLAEMSIPASKEELQKPKADRVRTIFEALLEFCVGVSPDEIRQPAYGGLDAFQWPELHEESASVANFVRRWYGGAVIAPAFVALICLNQLQTS